MSVSTDQENEEIRSEDEAEDQGAVQEATEPETPAPDLTGEAEASEAPDEEAPSPEEPADESESLDDAGEADAPDDAGDTEEEAGETEDPEEPDEEVQSLKTPDAKAPTEAVELPKALAEETEAPKDAVEAGAEEEDEEEEADEHELHIPPDPDDGTRRRWYAIHAYSGQEGNVKRNLLVQAEQENMKDVIGAVLVPMEEVAEIKSGEKKISKRKFFPGYVLVRLPEHPERNPELWHLIKETPGVSGFIGSRSVPVPLDDAEIQAIVDEIRGERERPKPKVAFEEGERIKIIDGPFSNFLGNIAEINADRGVLKVMVEIFERLTSVEVEFWQVEKV
jgi:transcription termination/antitermination protein NusG